MTFTPFAKIRSLDPRRSRVSTYTGSDSPGSARLRKSWEILAAHACAALLSLAQNTVYSNRLIQWHDFNQIQFLLLNKMSNSSEFFTLLVECKQNLK